MIKLARAALAISGALALVFPAASASATAAAAEGSGIVSVNTGSGWTTDPADPLFDFSRIVPGWTAAKTLGIRNDSDSSAALTFKATNVVDNENGCNRPESRVDTTCTGDNAGELGAEIILSVYGDADNDGVSDSAPSWTGSIRDLEQAGAFGELRAGATRSYKFVACLPSESGDETQTDSVSFDLVVGLDGATVAVEGTKTTRPPTSNPITRAIDQLPFTGTPAQRLVAAALTMLLIGTVLVLLLRRPRKRPESV